MWFWCDGKFGAPIFPVAQKELEKIIMAVGTSLLPQTPPTGQPHHSISPGSSPSSAATVWSSGRTPPPYRHGSRPLLRHRQEGQGSPEQGLPYGPEVYPDHLHLEWSREYLWFPRALSGFLRDFFCMLRLLVWFLFLPFWAFILGVGCCVVLLIRTSRLGVSVFQALHCRVISVLGFAHWRGFGLVRNHCKSKKIRNHEYARICG